MPNRKETSVICAKDDNGNAISYFGDLHPVYAGNVVKAMSSAKNGYPQISKLLANKPQASNETTEEFFDKISDGLVATVNKVERLTKNIVEVVIHAPFAAKNFQAGQFYRLQNFETNALKTADTTLAMEGLAVTGSKVDKDKGLISLIVLEMGGSSSLCAYLREGEEVVLMGPTGEPTEIIPNETVLLAGGGLGNAVLFSIGEEMREANCRVVYFAAYKDLSDRYKIEAIEKAGDIIIWCCDNGLIEASRSQDMSFHGNIVEAMIAYANGELGEASISLQEVDRIIAIGSDKMMAAVKNAKDTVLKEYFKESVASVGSINSPMQCMMKEICGQCLQKHVNEKGDEFFVYSCSNQDQNLDTISFSHLDQRLKQNSVQEKLTALWIKRELAFYTKAVN